MILLEIKNIFTKLLNFFTDLLNFLAGMFLNRKSTRYSFATGAFSEVDYLWKGCLKTKDSAVNSPGVAETEEGVCDCITDKIWHQQGAHDRI